VKANASSIGRSVDQPDPSVRLYLFLGQDEARSRALAARLLASLGAQKFVLAAGELKGNPALLADEAAALSLFGERRLIWIEPATNDIADAAKALLAAESSESPVAAIAGALTKSSPLLQLAEGSKQAVAFTAYAPDAEDAARIVADLGRRVGLKINPAVAARIAESCGNDQAVAGQELEKFAIFLGASTSSPKDLEHETIDAVGAESDADFLGLADLALLGDVAALAETIGRLPAGSAHVVPAIRSLQRRLLMLAPARARLERGQPVGAVMTSFGKSLFWKDNAAVEKMLRNWTANDLATAAQRAGLLERTLMFGDLPEREALGEELFTLARKARSAR
jgi:DNA polymerase-3 subunit delta